MASKRYKQKFYRVEPYTYIYAFVPDKDAWKKLVNGQYPLEEIGDAANATHSVIEQEDGTQMSAVCIHTRMDTKSFLEQISTIVHESVHVWQYAKKYVGEKETGTEHEAYAIETIVKNILTEYLNTRGPDEETVSTVAEGGDKPQGAGKA